MCETILWLLKLLIYVINEQNRTCSFEMGSWKTNKEIDHFMLWVGG